jgi:UDP-N-acetyl-D-glucosamine dehydrogenase
VDLAHEINSKTPIFHANKVRESIWDHKNDEGDPIRVLLAGVAYKENSEDVRETPAIEIVRRLREFGFDVSYFDTSVESFTVDGLALNKHSNINEKFDAVMLLHKFDESTIRRLSSSAQLVYDTKGQI